MVLCFLVVVGGWLVWLEIFGVEYFWVSDDIFLLKDVFFVVVVVGVGFIVCEFVCILCGFGVVVI